MKKAEIVIIGGGVVGASVAYHLTEKGAKDVLILEREAKQGLGSTGKATGGIRAQFETEINIKMSLYSLEFFKNWEFDCQYEPCGYLFFVTSEKGLDYLRRNVEKQKSFGVKDVEIVDTKTISEICPILNCEDIIARKFRRTRRFYQSACRDERFYKIGFSKTARRSNLKRKFFRLKQTAKKLPQSKRTKAESNAKK